MHKQIRPLFRNPTICLCTTTQQFLDRSMKINLMKVAVIALAMVIAVLLPSSSRAQGFASVSQTDFNAVLNGDHVAWVLTIDVMHDTLTLNGADGSHQVTSMVLDSAWQTTFNLLLNAGQLNVSGYVDVGSYGAQGTSATANIPSSIAISGLYLGIFSIAPVSVTNWSVSSSLQTIGPSVSPAVDTTTMIFSGMSAFLDSGTTTLGSAFQLDSRGGNASLVVIGYSPIEITPTPEPGTVSLLTIGGAAIVYAIRRRRVNQ